MGDLLLAFCRAPRTEDGTAPPEDVARRVLARRIDALPISVVEQAAASHFGTMSLARTETCAECGHGVALDPDGSDGVFVHDEARFDLDRDHVARPDDSFDEEPTERQMRVVLHEAVGSLFVENRVCYTIRLAGVSWVVTGGVSGGDSPTDEFDAVRVLGVVGITEAPIEEDDTVSESAAREARPAVADALIVVLEDRGVEPATARRVVETHFDDALWADFVGPLVDRLEDAATSAATDSERTV